MRTALALILMSGAAYADGLVVDSHRRPVTDLFTVRHHHVTVKIEDQHAVTEVDQVLRNISDRDAEVVYLFPVPKGARITGMEMWVGDKKMEGEILPAVRAREIYNSYVRAKQDPALLEYVGLGVYRTSIFPFARGEEKRLRIRYSELLAKDSGMVRYLYPLNTEKFSKHPLEEARIEVTIRSKGKIKTVYSPSHAVNVARGSETSARATWSTRKTTPRLDFELLYSVDEGPVGANLMTFRPEPGKGGYFLFLASPKVESEGKEEPKDIVFVLDCSGSMRADKKIDQARKALTFCLRSLNDGDRFGLVTFSTEVAKYSDRLVSFSAEEKERAAAHVATLEANGGTDINEALLQAMTLFEPGPRLKMVIFLTDGRPTVGVKNIPTIVKNVTGANGSKVRLFNFGVGYDVNTTLLDKLARENHGMSDYLKPHGNLEEKISGFYAKVQSPVLSDLRIAWGGMKVRDVLPRQIPDLFKGGQILLSGRYDGSGPAKLVLRGVARGKEQRFEFDVNFAERSEGEGKLFVEMVWAQRMIGDLIDQIHLNGKSEELVNEIVRLSTRYGIITEYTSFLVHEDVDLTDHGGNALRAGREVGKLRVDTGVEGQSRAVDKQSRLGYTQGLNSAFNDYQNGRGEWVRVTSVQNIGRRTFYQRGRAWQEVDTPKEVEAREIRYFTDDFFRLLEEHPELNRIAAMNAEVIVKAGDAYVRLARP